MDVEDVFGYDVNENVSISKIAKKYNNLSARKLNNLLNKCGVIYRDDRSESWLITDKYKNKGCAISEVAVFKDALEGHTYLLWTATGRELIHQMLKDELGLLSDGEVPESENISAVQKASTNFVIDDNISIACFADILKKSNITINGSRASQNNIFEALREHGFLNSSCGMWWNTPYKKFKEYGYFFVDRKYRFDGSVRYTTRLTPKGQKYFIEYFRKLM